MPRDANTEAAFSAKAIKGLDTMRARIAKAAAAPLGASGLSPAPRLVSYQPARVRRTRRHQATRPPPGHRPSRPGAPLQATRARQ